MPQMWGYLIRDSMRLTTGHQMVLFPRSKQHYHLHLFSSWIWSRCSVRRFVINTTPLCTSIYKIPIIWYPRRRSSNDELRDLILSNWILNASTSEEIYTRHVFCLSPFTSFCRQMQWEQIWSTLPFRI